MKNYKDLLSKKIAAWKKSFELWLLATEKRFVKAEKLIALLRRLLAQANSSRLYRYVDETTATDDIGVKTLAKNAVAVILQDTAYNQKPVNTVADLARLNLTIHTARKLTEGLSQFAGVQPMQAPVGLAFKLIPNEKDGIDLVSVAVEASTRKLQTEWSVEAMVDLGQERNLELGDELSKLVSDEIVSEFMNHARKEIVANVEPEEPIVVDFSNPFEFVSAKTQRLIEKINHVAARISVNTRRGEANFILCSPMVISLLQSSNAVFAPAIEGSFKGPNHFQLAGTLNGKIRVYSFIPNNASSDEDKIIVGYHGSNTDTGLIVCPYQLILTSGVLVNPATFRPQQNIMSRFGQLPVNPAYFAVIPVQYPANKPVTVTADEVTIEGDITVKGTKKARKKAPVAKYAKKTVKKATKKAVKKVPVPKKAVQASAPKAAKKAVKKVVKKVTKKKVVKKTK